MTKQSPRAFVDKDAAEWERDGWTSCPNAILRHPELPWELRAVWAWLASHTTAFELTAEKLRQAGPKGRDWAYSAIKELERWGLLTRHHEIAEGGQPVIRYKLHHRPVPEERRTYEPSKAAPRARQHPGVKEERTPDGPGIRSEQGVSDSPGLSPIPDRSGRRTPDRSGVPYKEEKTREKTNQPPPAASPPVVPVPASPGWLDGPPQPEGQAAAPPTTGAGVRFLADLEIRHRPDRHAWPRLAPLVEALLDGGWSWDDLKRAVTAGAHTADNPPGAVIRKIEKLERESRAEHLSRSELTERRKRADVEHAEAARAAAETRLLAIANCSMCDSDGFVGTSRCDHNPAAAEVHARGYAAASALLAAKKSARRQHDAAS